MNTQAASDFPTPDTAYEDAPRLMREITWVARTVADKEFGVPMGREFWLRKAALLDRLALTEGYDPQADTTASQAAEEAAHRLAQFDRDHHTTGGCQFPEELAAASSFRPYTRQEYGAWHSTRSGS